MITAFIIGINGKMGKILCDAAPVYGFNVSGGLDVAKTSENVFTSATDVNVPYDVIIDFSRPASLDAVIALAKRGNAPVVLATTGYTDEQTQKIAELAKTVPVFKSANMSLGIAAVTAAIKTVKAILGDSFDVEILEKHHNQKVDVPSGTALLLADAICPRENQVVNRSGKRVAGELGITSIRRHRSRRTRNRILRRRRNNHGFAFSAFAQAVRCRRIQSCRILAFFPARDLQYG